MTQTPKKRSALPEETYTYRDQVFHVTKEDAVRVRDAQTGKTFVMGYSHSRAYHSMLDAHRAFKCP